MRHVVGAVAEVAHDDSGEGTLAFPDGLEVAQDLAGVEPVGQGVDDRYAGDGGHRFDPVLAEGAPDDRRDLAVQDAGRVLDRFAAAELAAARVDDQGVAAELGDADGERHPGAGGGLIEEHGDGFGTGEHLVPERIGFEPVGEIEYLGLLGRGEVVVAEEVADHQALPSV